MQERQKCFALKTCEKLLHATSNDSRMKNVPATLSGTNIHANQAHQYCGEFIQKSSTDIFLRTALCCRPSTMIAYTYDFQTPVLLARVTHAPPRARPSPATPHTTDASRLPRLRPQLHGTTPSIQSMRSPACHTSASQGAPLLVNVSMCMRVTGKHAGAFVFMGSWHHTIQWQTSFTCNSTNAPVVPTDRATNFCTLMSPSTAWQQLAA